MMGDQQKTIIVAVLGTVVVACSIFTIARPLVTAAYTQPQRINTAKLHTSIKVPVQTLPHNILSTRPQTIIAHAQQPTSTHGEEQPATESFWQSLQLPAVFFLSAVGVLLAKGAEWARHSLQDTEGTHRGTSTALASALSLATIGNTFIVDPAVAFGFPVSEKQLYTDAWRAVNDSFIDKSFNGVDWKKVRDEALAKPLATRQETYDEIRASLDLLGDPFTRLLDPPQYDNIKRRLTGRLTGVGLEIAPVTEDGVRKMKVVDHTLDGPAEKAGIKDNDLILAVNGKPIGQASQWEVADDLVGDKNTQVILTLQTPGQDPRDVTVTRESVIFQSVKYSLCEGVPNQVYHDQPIERLGYIRVPSFNYSTAAEFNKAMKELTKGGADGVVIDLRSDTGGSLNAAYEMANTILPSGEIVRVIGYDGAVTSAQVRGRALYPDIPITLLVDDHTASSSEVLGAALKAAGRAEIAGEQTFGKGIIQDIKVLSDGSALFVTKERYLTPNNEEIDRVGIVPTVAVKKELLDTKTGLHTEPNLFCADMVREAPSLFSGPAPKPAGSHPDVDLNSLSAFC